MVKVAPKLTVFVVVVNASVVLVFVGVGRVVVSVIRPDKTVGAGIV